jgi:hypothetical protein
MTSPIFVLTQPVPLFQTIGEGYGFPTKLYPEAFGETAPKPVCLKNAEYPRPFVRVFALANPDAGKATYALVDSLSENRDGLTALHPVHGGEEEPFEGSVKVPVTGIADFN